MAAIDINDDADEDIHVLQVTVSQKAQRRIAARQKRKPLVAASSADADLHVLRVKVSRKAQLRLAARGRLKRKLSRTSGGCDRSQILTRSKQPVRQQRGQLPARMQGQPSRGGLKKVALQRGVKQKRLKGTAPRRQVMKQGSKLQRRATKPCVDLEAPSATRSRKSQNARCVAWDAPPSSRGDMSSRSRHLRKRHSRTRLDTEVAAVEVDVSSTPLPSAGSQATTESSRDGHLSERLWHITDETAIAQASSDSSVEHGRPHTQGIDDYFPDEHGWQDCTVPTALAPRRLVPRAVQLVQNRRRSELSVSPSLPSSSRAQSTDRELAPRREPSATEGDLYLQGELTTPRRAASSSSSVASGNVSSSSAAEPEHSAFLFVEVFQQGMAPRFCACCGELYTIGEFRLGYTPQSQTRAFPRWIRIRCASRARLHLEPGVHDIAFSPFVEAERRQRCLVHLSRQKRSTGVKLQRWSYLAASMQKWQCMSIPEAPAQSRVQELFSRRICGLLEWMQILSGRLCTLEQEICPFKVRIDDSTQLSAPIPAEIVEAELQRFSRRQAGSVSGSRVSDVPATWVDLNDIPLLRPDALSEAFLRNSRFRLAGRSPYIGESSDGFAHWQDPVAESPPAFSDEQIMRRQNLLLQLPEEVLKADHGSNSGERAAPSGSGDAALNTCAICQEAMCTGEVIRRLPCTHTFHRDCIDRWLLVRSTCPLDNRQLEEMIQGRND